MVTLATSYPFLDILWTILICGALVISVWMVIIVMIDIFSRPDLSGWGKAGWVVLIIVLPFLGVLISLIAYSAGIAERRAWDAMAAQTKRASDRQHGRSGRGDRHRQEAARPRHHSWTPRRCGAAHDLSNQ